MTRRQLGAGAFQSPLVLAGWIFAAVLPAIGLVLAWAVWLVLGPGLGFVLGTVALRQPEGAVRMQGALISAVSLTAFVMWSLILSGAGVRGLFLGS
jgi:hypothetical protein